MPWTFVSSTAPCHYKNSDPFPDCLNNSDLDLVLTDEVEDPSRDGYEHPCHALKKLLGGGTFYYSTDFDLTSRMQDRYVNRM